MCWIKVGTILIKFSLLGFAYHQTYFHFNNFVIQKKEKTWVWFHPTPNHIVPYDIHFFNVKMILFLVSFFLCGKKRRVEIDAMGKTEETFKINV